MSTKYILAAVALLIVITAGIYIMNQNSQTGTEGQAERMNETSNGGVEVTPIAHATMVLGWDGVALYTDPVGGGAAFAGQPEPDLILLTDIHSDHLDAETLQAVTADKTMIVAPAAVAAELPEPLRAKTMVLANGERTSQAGFEILAMPMYNLPESADSFHVKGRGNGYVVERDGTRVYISGDTEDIPEMRALRDIDIAFVAMNLPFTMGVESAADAVLEFRPKRVYPYHYRGREGLSDVGRFKELVDAGDAGVEVVLLDWYSD